MSRRRDRDWTADDKILSFCLGRRPEDFTPSERKRLLEIENFVFLRNRRLRAGEKAVEETKRLIEESKQPTYGSAYGGDGRRSNYSTRRP